MEHKDSKNFLIKLFSIWARTKSVTSLGHQAGRRIFWEGPNFFNLGSSLAQSTGELWSCKGLANMGKLYLLA